MQEVASVPSVSDSEEAEAVKKRSPRLPGIRDEPGSSQEVNQSPDGSGRKAEKSDSFKEAVLCRLGSKKGTWTRSVYLCVTSKGVLGVAKREKPG